MNGDRKYRQSGYQDSGESRSSVGSHANDSKLRVPAPRHPMDATAPRLPRMVQTVTASRCYSCSTALPEGFDFRQPCAKCQAELHCCKQCAHFEPSARFQCLKPIPERLAYKDRTNDCTLFTPRVTVARDASVGHAASASAAAQNGPPATPVNPNKPVRSSGAHDARAAFENLFKK